MTDKTNLEVIKEAMNLKGEANKKFVGMDAVREVERREGKKLTPAQRRVVIEEGFVNYEYDDHDGRPWESSGRRGTKTFGVGQTREFIDMPFEASYQHHVDRIKGRLPDFDMYPDYLQEELIQSEYRGDTGLSPKAMRLLREGRAGEASVEFLDHAEYKNPLTRSGVRNRISSVSKAMARYSNDRRVAGAMN